MKMLVFLLVVAAVVALVVRKMRKTQAEAELARRKETERRKKEANERLTPELDMTWPVIIRPATGKDGGKGAAAVDEPSMATIEYKPPERAAS